MSSSCLNSLISHTRLAGRWWVSKSQGEKLQINRRVGCAPAELQLSETVESRAQGCGSCSMHSPGHRLSAGPRAVLCWTGHPASAPLCPQRGLANATMSTQPLKQQVRPPDPPILLAFLSFPSKANAQEGKAKISS